MHNPNEPILTLSWIEMIIKSNQAKEVRLRSGNGGFHPRGVGIGNGRWVAGGELNSSEGNLSGSSR